MRFTVITALLFCMVAAGLGQTINQKVHDFGTVQNWDNPVAEFSITNSTAEELVILPTFSSGDILVDIPEKKIAPGESGSIYISYYTAETGNFSRTVKLYTSASPEPVELTVKGNIASFASNALLACPTLKPKTDEDKEFMQEFLVIDAITKERLEGAELTVSERGNRKLKEYTDKLGLVREKTLQGRFTIHTSRNGYQDTSFNTYLAIYRGRVIIELSPLKVTPPPTAQVPEDQQPPEEIIIAETPVPVPTPAPANTGEPETINGLSTAMYQPNNVLFLIDISKSMSHADKLPLLKRSMKELVSVLRDIDKITVVVYNMEPRVLIPPTSAINKAAILAGIDSLEGYGWTHGVKGIENAYQTVHDHYIAAGNNQIILSTDGVFNGPLFDESELLDLVQNEARNGVKLSVVGFGDDRDGIRLMRRIANSGGGSFIRFGDADTRDALIEEIKKQSLIHP